ncbi:MAG: 3-isopropylmalate dehydratase large subunit [candidate division NC10 bacterium CSP1-5]|nr:MAG: 3-isopropylmalate dehydratase large subunit [candidate division NC10 bacterium CSP1-5]
MGMTLAEKILAQKLGHEVRAGDVVICPVDLALVQDGTGTLTFDVIRQLMGKDTLKHPDRAMIVLDHLGPPGRPEYAAMHKRLRDFVKATGCLLAEVGEGISHVLISERYVKPGDVIVGADSHTNTAAGMAAFATGMGSTDTAVAMALGKQWFRVPETMRFELRGRLPVGVSSKDIILHIIGTIGEDGAVYKAMEYDGETIRHLSMDARFTITSMAQECGAKLGLFPSDEETRRWMQRHGREKDWRPLAADPGAAYERLIEIECAALEPLVAVPHTPGNVKQAAEVEKEGIRVDQVFLGTCTNGRLEDLRAAAQILKGRRVAQGTRLLVYPGSRWVYHEALKEGVIQALEAAGAVIGHAACGPCPGMQFGLLSDGEVCMATQNRNFKGRMGNPNSFLYLASPWTAAATAVEGRITDPRRFLA